MSYRPIALLSPIAKTLEKIILPHITSNTIIPPHQHSFRHKHSTTTALHEINNTITKGFNNKKQQQNRRNSPRRSKAFDTVNPHTFIHKLHNTNILNTILKYIANYIKGREQYTLYNNHKFTLRNTKTGAPQGGVLSPTLFNIYTADLPTPTSPNITTVTRRRHDHSIITRKPTHSTTTSTTAGLPARWSDQLVWGLERGWRRCRVGPPWGRQQQIGDAAIPGKRRIHLPQHPPPPQLGPLANERAVSSDAARCDVAHCGVEESHHFLPVLMQGMLTLFSIMTVINIVCERVRIPAKTLAFS